MNAKLSFRDFLWVLVAYLRGKVLRQKNYRRQGSLFPIMPGATIKRMTNLMNWWGYRPMTVEEVTSLEMEMVESGRDPYHFPYARWTNAGICVDWLNDGQCNDFQQVLGVRRSR